MCDSSEQGDRQRMEIKSFENVVDQIRSFAVLVDAVECATCSLQRRYWNVESFAAERDDGDSGGNAETDVNGCARRETGRVG